MVPVSLRLKNFLSYRDSAPVLDFEQFHVACLSGRNGQGKSALLEAITWALWGEARKASDSRKPDEALLHVGALQMEVELVFDLEGCRYRVMRSFQRSATGKTNKSGLEFHIYDAEAGAFHPLTEPSLRQTQARIEAMIGLDYDTFINSAFLLQGRSDEFTKKRPSERKEILAKILGLDRYERLAIMARDREREAGRQVERVELEIERLQKALEDEPAWKQALEETTAALAEGSSELETLRQAEDELKGQQAARDARRQEAASLRETLRSLCRRIEDEENEIRELGRRIGQAEALLARRDAIERDHERSLRLREEEDGLVQKQHLFNGYREQVMQVEAKYRDRRHEIEQQIRNLELRLETDRKRLADGERELALKPSLERQLDGALKARAQREQERVRRERARELDEAVARQERLILKEEEAIKGEIRILRNDITVREKEVATLPEMEARMAEMKAGQERRDALTRRLEEITEAGQTVKLAITDNENRAEMLRQRRETVAESLASVQSLDEDHCPTCGSELTPEHRRRVVAQFTEQLEALDAELAGVQQALTEAWKQREALLAEYKQEKKRHESLAGVLTELAALEARMAETRKACAQLEEKRQTLGALVARLETGDFAAEARAEKTRLEKERAALAFDREAFERLTEQAAQVQRFQERLDRLAALEGEMGQLKQAISTQERRLEEFRIQLDSGEELMALQQQINTLKQQAEAVGFDAARLEEVRRELKGLGDAGKRVSDLLNAEKNTRDWSRRQEELRNRLVKEREEEAALRKRLSDAEAGLAGADELTRALASATHRVKEQEAHLARLQSEQGRLTSHLQKAKEDREALKQARKERREADSDRALYKHLRQAFGRQGIPSLIIEETLPDIEERANDLLDRLTEGRMHVQLQTLRDKKTGGTKETLDIIISDSQGVPRPYETFSGGEAFRVNFALRIALAQLLAERSGVQVRTLVIDEGFGTQDEDGVDNLVGAIKMIQDDFDKILVITHLDRMKESFPVRIEVAKDPARGSLFNIMGV